VFLYKPVVIYLVYYEFYKWYSFKLTATG